MVQFERDQHFVGREDIMKEIEERLKLQPHRVALAGIGGVGKSRIAIEYCYRYKDNHPEARVFWVHASNIARFEQAYKDIATELDLPGLDDPNTNILQLVTKWFADDGNGPWLFILDNADDEGIFFGSNHSSPKDGQQQMPLLSSFLPRSSNGSTIVTTRDKRVGQKLSNNGKPISVLPFALSDAKSLLRPKLSSDDKWCEPEATELLRALEFLPLAITQAAAFINENDITTAKYLELLQGSDLETTHLLEEDLFDPGRDRDIRNSVFQTWKLSFNQIAKQKPRAADILSLMAFLDRQAISHELLRDDDESERDFITAIGTLKAFSLIIEEKQGLVFGMHRLVQLSTQKWLEHQHETVKWQEKALGAVSKCCPKNGEYERWPSWKAISPHVEVVLGYAVMESGQLERASILNSVGYYDLRQGRLEAAQQKYAEALEIRQIELGEEHLNTVATFSGLALVFESQGKYEAAEEMHRRALDGSERALGKDHPYTLSSFKSLVGVLRKQGKHDAAEEVERRFKNAKKEANEAEDTASF
ncbi:hypothetical protein K440DRAFT_554061 [Wilcoxina mikolae CBS 423.85]|nr:hypothetical protein K440DRAFT_554061 [Wilcoxina mikolae CBS 423.85]